MHQTCPICAWINPETRFDADISDKDDRNRWVNPVWRMLRHLMDVHYTPGAVHQPWEDKVFTKVRIEND